MALDLHLKKGALHKALGIPEDKKIPSTLLQIKPGDSAHMKKMKRMALAMRKWKH